MRSIKTERLSGRTVSVRWILYAAFASLVLLIAGLILTISLIKTSQSADDLAKPLIESAQRQTDANCIGFLAPWQRTQPSPMDG